MITYKKARDKRKLGLEAALVQLLLIVIAIAAVALVALYFLGLIGHAAPKGGVVIKSVACKPCSNGDVAVKDTVQNDGNIKEKITLTAVPTSSSAGGCKPGSSCPCVCPGKCCTICITGLSPGCGYNIIVTYCANHGSIKGSVSYPLTPV